MLLLSLLLSSLLLVVLLLLLLLSSLLMLELRVIWLCLCPCRRLAFTHRIFSCVGIQLLDSAGKWRARRGDAHV